MSWLLGAKALLRYPPFCPALRRVLLPGETHERYDPTGAQ